MKRPSKYQPHQGLRECGRRIRQRMARLARLTDQRRALMNQMIDAQAFAVQHLIFARFPQPKSARQPG